MTLVLEFVRPKVFKVVNGFFIMSLGWVKIVRFKMFSFFLLSLTASFHTFEAKSASESHEEHYQIQFDRISTLPKEQQNQQLLHLAKELNDLHRYDETIPIYRQILKGIPCLEEATEVWLAIADAYQKNNQLEKALHELEAMQILLPDSSSVKERAFTIWLMLARAKATQKESQKSVEYYEKALAIDPTKRLHILREYADQLTYDSKSDLAIPLYQEILTSSPSDEEKKATLVGLARAYTWRQNYQEAIKTHQLILQIDPNYNSYAFFITLAKEAADHNHPQISSEYYLKAIELNPTQKNVLIRDYTRQLSYAGDAQKAIAIDLELLKTDLSPQEKRLIELDLAQAFVWTKQYPLAMERYEALLLDNPNDIEAKKGNAQIYLDYGNFHASKNQHKEALEWYEKALALDPDRRKEILKLIADELKLNSQPDLAIPKYLEILYCYPSPEMYYQAKIGLARAYIANRQIQEGIALLNEILRENPNDKNVESILLNTYIDFARYDASHNNPISALNWYLNAMALDPTQRSSLLREYAVELVKNGQALQAIPLFKEMLDANPIREDIRLVKLDLAQAYVSIFHYKEALSIYDELLKANPDDALARRGKAQIYMDYARYDAGQGEHTKAISSYKEAIAIDPTIRLQILKELAVQLELNSEDIEAISIYREILETRLPREEQRILRLNLAHLYAKQYRYEEALNQYDFLLQQNQYDQVARQGKAQVYVNYALYNSTQNRPEEAIDWYKKAMEHDPILIPELLKKIAEENVKIEENKKAIHPDADLPKKEDPNQDFLIKQAREMAKDGRHVEAVEIYRQAIEKDQANRRAILREYADEFFYSSQADLAIPLYRELLAGDLDFQERRLVLLGLARALKVIGEKAESLEIYEEILSVDPNDPEAIQGKAQIMAETQSIKEEKTPLELLPQESEQQSPSSDKQEEPKKEWAKAAYENALELAKRLEVFQANRAFKFSLEEDPYNKGYREKYAWHLQAFSFIEEAVPQFYLLLPEAKEKKPFYTVLGWDLRSLGQLDQSVWAFSHLYPIPYCFTLSNKFILIGNLYRREEYRKINELYRLLECGEGNEWEIRKKLFDAYAYLGDMKEAGFLAQQILSVYPNEYVVHYRYAHTLYQKRMYCESALQYQLLLEKLPGNAFLYLSLGNVYEEMGCLESSKEAYQTAFYLDQNSRTERAYARILSKLGCCFEAEALAHEIIPGDGETLTKSLSVAETNLNCGSVETASAIYRNVLDEYPYNQEALWGILKASTITDNFDDNRLGYRRWSTVWFNYPFQNYLADYYRSPDVTLSSEYFTNSSKFRSFAIGSGLSQYVGCNTRIAEGYYFTQFSQKHFDTIDRNTAFVNFQKFFDKGWEGQVRLIGNHYHKLQKKHSTINQVSGKLYSKWIYNCHFHLLNHVTDELAIDVGYDYYDVIDTVPPFDNPIYDYSSQIGATALNIRTSDLNVFFNYTKERFYVMGNWITGRYSDGNTKHTRFVKTGYRICEIPVVNMYYSYFFLNFKKAAPLFLQNGFSEGAYYDPKNFEIHIFGIDSNYHVTEKLQLGGELAAVYIPKCKNFAYSASTFLDYLLDDQWSLRIDLRYYYQNRSLNRNGITGYYHANSANLQVRYQF